MKKINIIIMTVLCFVFIAPITAQSKDETQVPQTNTSEQMCIMQEHMNISCNDSVYVQLIKKSITLAVLDMLITGYNKDGEPIYLSTCARQFGGCEKHIRELTNYFYEQYELRGINPMIFFSIGFHETLFDSFAINENSGSSGVLQIMPYTNVGRDIRFIHDRKYRRECREVIGGCQREIVEAGAGIIERSMRRCGGNMAKALGMYGSGNCNGSRSFSRYVMRLAGELEAAQEAHLAQLVYNQPY